MKTLDEISPKYFTDKGSTSGDHNYLIAYEKYTSPMRVFAKNILEIGVASGESMGLWNEYFINANIHGIDITPELNGILEKPFRDTSKIQFHIGKQQDVKFLKTVVDSIGAPLDLIIDDGGHVPEQMIKSVMFLQNYLSPEGYYILEDIWVTTCDVFRDAIKKSDLEIVEEYSDSKREKGVWCMFVLRRRR